MYQHTKHIKASHPQPCDRCVGIIQQADPIHETIAIEGDVMTVTTQPGSKSQQNVQRRGFDLLYSRTVLVLSEGQSANDRHQ